MTSAGSHPPSQAADRRAGRSHVGPAALVGQVARVHRHPGPRVVVPDHPRPQLAEHPLLPGRRVHPPRAGPQRGRGAHRPARPRLRGLLRGRRLHDRQAHDGGGLAHGVGGPAARHRGGDGGRRGARRADPAPPRRLPRHRHPRLRRDRADLGPEQPEPRRGARASPASPTRRASATRSSAPSRCPTTTSCWSRSSSSILLVARMQALAGRALLGGHPGGRGRRRAHGRAHLQDEAVVVRGGRRRSAGSAGWIYATKVAFINPATFPFTVSILILAAVVLGGLGSTPGVIAGAFAVGFLPEYLRDAGGERHARLPEQRHRRQRRRHHRVPRLPLRPRPRAHDAVPAAGPAPEPPARRRAGRVHQHRRGHGRHDRRGGGRGARRGLDAGPSDARRCPPTWSCPRRP